MQGPLIGETRRGPNTRLPQCHRPEPQSQSTWFFPGREVKRKQQRLAKLIPSGVDPCPQSRFLMIEWPQADRLPIDAARLLANRKSPGRGGGPVGLPERRGDRPGFSRKSSRSSALSASGTARPIQPCWPLSRVPRRLPALPLRERCAKLAAFPPGRRFSPSGPTQTRPPGSK